MHGKLSVVVALAVAACASAVVARPDVVQPGLEVLLRDSLHLVQGRRVGLVTNQSGVDRAGRHGVERLLEAGVDLQALFSPEHGFRGAAAPGEHVANSVDSATGLPIYSLYGRTLRPTPEMLEGLDVILVDLQDVGARYYTWLGTTVAVMRSAAAAGIPVVVLDRPNPIGALVQGNILDTAYTSLVGQLAVPMRHGLTLGELARLAQRDLAIDGTLTVVPAGGWQRDMMFASTGLPYVPPSPNLPDLESLLHYPGLCLFEGTALSVGRGSDAPFHQIGAPWLDTTAVLARVRAADLPGVRFRGVRFKPTSPGDGKFADSSLVGIRLEATDPARYDPTATAVHLLAAVRAVHPGRMGWRASHFDRLAGTDQLRLALESGTDPGTIVAGWTAAREAWNGRVERFRLAY